MAELEKEAVALVRQYGLLLPKGVKDFMRRLADQLEWVELRKVLK